MSRAAFAEAIRSDDAAAVRAVLDRYPALAAQLDAPLAGYSFGTTALLAAVSQRNSEMIEVLLGAGADINARSHWWAGSFGVLDTARLDYVPFLMKRGAKLDAHSASRLGLLPELTAMLDANPDLVNARGGDGQTPLHFASTIKIAALLLERGAKIDARDVDHESTPSQYMLGDRRDVAKFLVERGCRTDILMAAAVGDVECVRHYLEADPKSVYIAVSERYFPKTNPDSGGTIYYWTIGTFNTAHAVAGDNRSITDLLIEYTPPDLRLVLAAQENDTALVTRLLHADPLPEFANENLTATALHWAAWHGNTRMVEALLSCKAPLEIKDAQYDGSPLGWAQHAASSGQSTPGANFSGTFAALEAAGAQPVSRG